MERIAEELMGRRKWKLYQESMSRNYLQPLNNNINRTNPSSGDEYHHHNNNTSSKPTTTTTATTLTKSQQFLNIDSEKNESSNNNNKIVVPSLIDSNISIVRDINEKESKEYQQQQKENNKSAAAGNDIKQELLEDRLKDWSPQTKCYFCVDGKLDSEHSAHGVLVRALNNTYIHKMLYYYYTHFSHQEINKKITRQKALLTVTPSIMKITNEL